ncbi:siderophore-interacting protein [Microlunatus elymi]|uniref:Siderophore-interacting protein n=1 Tax=Microlunatus elymi TaxID=2596828 RepID=A0A516Q1W4_9ACTN|nr:siderophore-interacting protein [Microlunatus elymi]QDP97429.1 siderophore-interacting protein [Microlunatus elymi]
MTETLTSDRMVKPNAGSVTDAVVINKARVSSGFVRVTVECRDPRFVEEFDHLGFDQWVRLFLPNEHSILEPPYGGLEGWYRRWTDAEPDRRPVIRNYTIRAARRIEDGWELDIDFVVHGSASGAVEGIAANWACSAQPGDRVALLDQGRIFAPADDDRPILIIADESGVPGVEGIARSLAGRPATYLLEVPHADDVRDLAADAQWLVRDSTAMPGRHLLERLAAMQISPDSYGYVVGEASMMLAARNMIKAAGVPKSRLDFCAYWRPLD